VSGFGAGTKKPRVTALTKPFITTIIGRFLCTPFLKLFVQNNCNAGGLRNLDMMYMSELDPTWNVDELAFFMNPEAVVFANPLAVAACMVDCATTTASMPMTSLVLVCRLLGQSVSVYRQYCFRRISAA
jgi:hypothetical protein